MSRKPVPAPPISRIEPAFGLFSAPLTLVTALIACFGVLLQLVLSLRLAVANGRPLFGGLIIYLSFFTVLTNIFVSLCLSAPLVSRRSTLGRFFRRPVVVTSAAASILVVGVTYFLLLRNVWDPQGWQLVADITLHYVTPVLFMVHWWREARHLALTWTDVPRMLAYPVIYIAYSLARGAITQSYPYYFVDATLLGYPRALVNAAGVLLALALVSAMLVGIARALSSTSRRP